MQYVRILQEPLQFYKKFWRTTGIDVACTSKLVKNSTCEYMILSAALLSLYYCFCNLQASNIICGIN